MERSKTEEAIKLLKIQREKLEDKKTYINNVWDLQTRELIKKYFGENSEFYKEARRISVELNLSGKTKDEIDAAYTVWSGFTTMFIDGCIEYLKHNGVFETPLPLTNTEVYVHSVVAKGDNITQSGSFDSGIKNDSNNANNSPITMPTPTPIATPNQHSPTKRIQKWQLGVAIFAALIGFVLFLITVLKMCSIL